jgi:hypothetical protein
MLPSAMLVSRRDCFSHSAFHPAPITMPTESDSQAIRIVISVSFAPSHAGGFSGAAMRAYFRCLHPEKALMTFTNIAENCGNFPELRQARAIS